MADGLCACVCECLCVFKNIYIRMHTHSLSQHLFIHTLPALSSLSRVPPLFSLFFFFSPPFPSAYLLLSLLPPTPSFFYPPPLLLSTAHSISPHLTFRFLPSLDPKRVSSRLRKGEAKALSCFLIFMSFSLIWRSHVMPLCRARASRHATRC